MSLEYKIKRILLLDKSVFPKEKSKFKSWKNLYVLQIKLPSLSMFSHDIDFWMFFEFGTDVANN